MTDEETRDLFLRVAHLVSTYFDVCEAEKDLHAARILEEIRKVTGDT